MLSTLSTANSIREILPFNTGGRIAREGFIYQDHIAAGLCIELLLNQKLLEIWLETHDDIDLFWDDGQGIELEFVQVKHADRPSRWSIASICGDGDPTKAIVKKSLDQDRFKEPAKFRIISSYDVNDDLAVLKHARNSTERKSKADEEIALSEGIIKKLGEIKSPNGNGIHAWVQSCIWEKKAEALTDLINSNKIALEKAIELIDKPIFTDQRDEIYQKILSYCQNASSGELYIDSDEYKIEKDKFRTWLSRVVDAAQTPSSGTQPLTEKLARALNVPADYIENAKQLTRDYLSLRLREDFIKSSDRSVLEAEVHSSLLGLKIDLDSAKIGEDEFHQRCIEKLDEIKQSPRFNAVNVPDFILKGYMYQLANRCLLRFRRATHEIS